MPDADSRFDDVHARMTEAEKENLRDHGETNRRIERQTAQIEEQGRNVKALTKVVNENAKQIQDTNLSIVGLVAKHDEVLNKMDGAYEMAEAARDLSEDLNLKVSPAVVDYNERKEHKKDWRKWLFSIGGIVAAAVLLLFLGWLGNETLRKIRGTDLPAPERMHSSESE